MSPTTIRKTRVTKQRAVRVIQAVIVLQILLAVWDFYRHDDFGVALHIVVIGLLGAFLSIWTTEQPAPVERERESS